MCHKCYTGFLAALIIVFSFWMTAYSKWIIVIAAGLIFLKNVYYLILEGCSTCSTCGTGHHTGTELFMEKGSEELHEGPRKSEIEEVLKKK